jgi:hypothetical protein
MVERVVNAMHTPDLNSFDETKCLNYASNLKTGQIFLKIKMTFLHSTKHLK